MFHELIQSFWFWIRFCFFSQSNGAFMSLTWPCCRNLSESFNSSIATCATTLRFGGMCNGRTDILLRSWHRWESLVHVVTVVWPQYYSVIVVTQQSQHAPQEPLKIEDFHALCWACLELRPSRCVTPKDCEPLQKQIKVCWHLAMFEDEMNKTVFVYDTNASSFFWL